MRLLIDENTQLPNEYTLQELESYKERFINVKPQSKGKELLRDRVLIFIEILIKDKKENERI